MLFRVKKVQCPAASLQQNFSDFLSASARIDFKCATGLGFLFQCLGWPTPMDFFFLSKHLNNTRVVLLTYLPHKNVYRMGRGPQRRIHSEDTYMCVYICLHVYQAYNVCKNIQVICRKWLYYSFCLMTLSI